LIDDACEGKIARLAEKIDRNPSYISRLLYPEGKDGARHIGDEIAEATENAFGLRKAWLDLPLGTLLPSDPEKYNPSRLSEPLELHGVKIGRASWPFERVSAADYERLSAPQRAHVEDTVLLLLGSVDERKSSSGR